MPGGILRLACGFDHRRDPWNSYLTTGAMGALYQCLRCLVNPGDEVVIPSPHWVNYAHMTQLCGGEAIFVPTRSDNGFHVRANEIEKYVSSKTKVLIINSPNNPTGAVLTEKEIREIAEVVLKYDIALITDEAYSAICYSDRYFSFLQIPEVRPNLILIDSCSKRYAMTGWRIGYAVGPQELIDSMVKMQENVVACASVPAQFAAIEALNGSQESVRRMRDEFQQRRDYLYGRICTMDKVKMYHPEGAFYAFVDIRDTNMDSLTFARTLLQIMHVAVVPGITYGSAGEGYVRIAYTVDMQSLVCACDRLEVFLKEGV